MKNLIKKLGKGLAIQAVAFSIIVGGVAFAAVTFPTSTPVGQTAGGKFMEYFNKIRVQCDPGQALQGFDSNFDKICVSLGTVTTTPITTFTCGSNITVGGFTYTTKIGLDGKCWTSTNMKHTPTSGNSWCYGNNSSNCNTYGRLYDWSAAMTICSTLGTGWTLPTYSHWTDLTNAGATGWTGNRLSLFLNPTTLTSLPGYWDSFAADFYALNDYGYWWTSTPSGNTDPNVFFINSQYNSIGRSTPDKGFGFSVLCINPTITGTPAPTTPIVTAPKVVYTDSSLNIVKTSYVQGDKIYGYVEGGDVNNTYACTALATNDTCLDGQNFRKLTVSYNGNTPDEWQYNSITKRIELKAGFSSNGFPIGTYNSYVKTGLNGSVSKITFTLTSPYSWYTGSFGDCSASCGAGYSYRSVYCQINGSYVNDSYCNGLDKPITYQDCNNGECPPPASCSRSKEFVFGPCGISPRGSCTCGSSPIEVCGGKFTCNYN